MGAYLSSPVLDKESESGASKRLRFGVSQMQGWRRTMEDAHLAVPVLEGKDNAAVFGVFDGHGGREVALFVAKHLVEELVQAGPYREGKHEEALRAIFHRMDEMLRMDQHEAEIRALKAGAPPPPQQQQGNNKPSSDNDNNNNDGDGSGIDDSTSASGEGPDAAAGPPPPNPGGGMMMTHAEAIEMLQQILVITGAASSGAATTSGQQQQQQQQPVGGRASDEEDDAAAEGDQLLLLPDDDEEEGSGRTAAAASEGKGEGGAREEEEEEGGRRPARGRRAFGGDDDDDDDDDDGNGGDEGGEDDEMLMSPQPVDPSFVAAAADGSDVMMGGPRQEADVVVLEEEGDGEDLMSRSQVAEALLGGEEGGVVDVEVEEEDDESSGDEEEAAAAAATGSSTRGRGGQAPPPPPPPPPPATRGAAKAALSMPIRLGGGGVNKFCSLPDHRVQAGCTSVVALLVGDRLYVANAGDSRAVLCRAGKALGLSEDHKPQQEREMERIRKAGGFVTDQGRVNGNLNLSRSIGDLKYKGNTALGPEEQMITAEPDVACVTIKEDEDEFFIMACDGVWDCKTNQQAVDFVRERLCAAAEQGEEEGPVLLERIAEELLDECVAQDPRKTGGIGGDNMTCLIVDLRQQQKGAAGRLNNKQQQEEQQQAT